MQASNDPVEKKFFMQVDGPPRKRGRPKRTWIEAIKTDMKKCNLSEDLTKDRLDQRNKMHVADSNTVGTRL